MHLFFENGFNFGYLHKSLKKVASCNKSLAVIFRCISGLINFSLVVRSRSWAGKDLQAFTFTDILFTKNHSQ
ncbi:MAG: hypothetical protein EA394_01380 [Bacteroidia bacterium]|nr:MAG: hypothetical protein EA394_01380 [Bacteroidia bacterium]